MRINALSAMGRMSYGAHLVLYPMIGGSVYFMGSTWLKNNAEAAKKQAEESLPAYRSVDPDDFQPFSAIPFHNNPELRYRYANTKMFGYLNSENHLNARDYPYRTYFDVYDHDNSKTYKFTWVSNAPSDEARREAAYRA